MHHPDSTEGVRDLHPFASVARLDELLPIAPERPNTP